MQTECDDHSDLIFNGSSVFFNKRFRVHFHVRIPAYKDVKRYLHT